MAKTIVDQAAALAKNLGLAAERAARIRLLPPRGATGSTSEGAIRQGSTDSIELDLRRTGEL